MQFKNITKEKTLSALASLTLLLAAGCDRSPPVVEKSIMQTPVKSPGIEQTAGGLVLSGAGYAVTFSSRDGAITSVVDKTKGADSIWQSEKPGLWAVTFEDNSGITAAQFSADSTDHTFRYEIDKDVLRLVYSSAEVELTVTATPVENGVDLRAQVKPATKTIFALSLPARLIFAADAVQRVITTLETAGTGVALKAGFFQRQPESSQFGWAAKPKGPGNYAALVGAPLQQRPDNDPQVAIKATPEASAWFTPELISSINASQVKVNRPPAQGQADVVLIDSVNGPFLSASRLGGSGALWRFGGMVLPDSTAMIRESMGAVLEKLTSSPEWATRKKIGVVGLQKSPPVGFALLSAKEWLNRINLIPGVAHGQIEVVELTSLPQLLGALDSTDFLAILNPYGEYVPSAESEGTSETIGSIGKFIKAGGNWIETTGYPFYYEWSAGKYNQAGTSYPQSFTDFYHLESAKGNASWFSVQPRGDLKPWEAANDTRRILVPVKFATGANKDGGWTDRSFFTYGKAGATWQSPVIRMLVGVPLEEGIDKAVAANGVSRKLVDKYSPEVYEKLKNSVLVAYEGPAKDQIDSLDLLPSPSLIHFANYMKYGFDRGLPEHLPPNAGYGTEADFRRFYDEAHKRGLLMMPYANPTWWNTNPRSETFLKAGEDPLLKQLDGKIRSESYGGPDQGFSITMWHPAVRAANEVTLQQFTKDYPTDILFYDQVGGGGRNTVYDINPASPTPYANSEGLISLSQEHSATVPLSVECGWLGLSDHLVQFCGVATGLFPSTMWGEAVSYMKNAYDPATWEMYPLVQRMTQDKVQSINHDLAQFVRNQRELTWTLSLGYGLSFSISPTILKCVEGSREWLYWLDRVQKSVVSKYIGEKVGSFQHEQSKTPGDKDEGIVRAVYGPVNLFANLEPRGVETDGVTVAPHGFLATAPGMVAGRLQSLGGTDFGTDGISFVAESREGKPEVWVYAAPETEAAVLLPKDLNLTGAVNLAFDGHSVAGKVSDGVLRFTLPSRDAGNLIAPPPGLADKAPAARTGEKPWIGVLDLGPDFPVHSTKMTPNDWVNGFEQSSLVKEQGLVVKRITTVAELLQALNNQAGSNPWFAIINPYGEGSPSKGKGEWSATIEGIRSYVRNGGIWWETSGLPYCISYYQENGVWKGETSYMVALNSLGIIANITMFTAAKPIVVTEKGKEWFDPALVKTLETQTGLATWRMPSRLAGDSPDSGHVTLVRTGDFDYLGGYRLGGWGWFFRIAQSNADPATAIPLAVASTTYLLNHPPVLLGGEDRTKFLWHATVSQK